MGVPRGPKPVKLFSGLIFKEDKTLLSVQKKLTRLFGETDFESDVFPFDNTRYYEKEMGSGLKRKIIFFTKLIQPDSLPEVKLKTNEIEKELSGPGTGNRTVNIDPGYLAIENVVLATTKGFTHRPYLSSGIFAELTYFYKGGSFRTLEWTYPEFRLPERIEMFNQLRDRYFSGK